MGVRFTSALTSLAFIGLSCAVACLAHAAESVEDGPAAQEYFAIHGQATYVEQEDNCFRTPYGGPYSLRPCQGRETADATLFLGVRPWRAAEIWLNPEIDQGFGLSNTLGVAGFPSGEAYKVGANEPYFRLQRIFVRQTVETDGEPQTTQGTANQLRGSRSSDRWVFTLGKFAVTDVFDTNQYAHDPREDFLNWASIDAGTFDYAADSWGYTEGAAAEVYRGQWTWRAGVFELSKVPNSEVLEHSFDEFQLDAEIERRYPLFGQTGRVLITAFESRGRMGLYDEAIALGDANDRPPSTASVRRYRGRLGVSVSVEQPLTDEMGLFARIGKAQGNTEVYEFADIDESTAIGASIRGAAWRRPADVAGFAAIDNRVSSEFTRYLDLGGLGILVGDGKLPHPGAEQILESYYELAASSWAQVTVDYQWIRNPAYNPDRGPVSIFAMRVHVHF